MKILQQRQASKAQACNHVIKAFQVLVSVITAKFLCTTMPGYPKAANLSKRYGNSILKSHPNLL